MKKILLIYTLVLAFQFQLNAQKTKEDFIALAVENVQKKNYEAAINFFTYVIENFKQDSLAYFDRGLVKKMMRDYDGAIADFTSQIKFDSSNADSYFLRGIVKDHLEDYKGAIKDYELAVLYDFDNSDAHFFLGRNKIRIGQLFESQKHLKYAIEINPENSPAWAYSAWTKIQQNDYATAKKELDICFKIDSSEIQSYYFKAFLEADLQQFEESFQSIISAINLNPTYTIEYLESKNRKHKIKDFKEILSKFNSIKPENQSTKDLIIHGFVNLYFKDIRSSKIYFEKVTQKHKTNHVAFYGLALINYLQKDYSNALSNINLALEFIPGEENYENLKERIMRKSKNSSNKILKNKNL